jgi:4-carboxymuconolactone decarboxylase
MDHLTPRERELVALGSALASNCVPCVEYHIPQARNAGLTDPQMAEAIRLADQVRQVPARKVLDAAYKLLPQNISERPGKPGNCSVSPAPAEGRSACCSLTQDSA